MRIVVVGAGKLGYSVAEMLSKEQYDVVVVEQDSERQEVVRNNLDVLVLGCNGATPIAMEEADVKEADVLIATTDSDEVNMVTCLLAKQAGIKHTVARIRSMDYAEVDSDFLQKRMGVDLMIFPEQIMAQEIVRILLTPSAMDVEDFADGKVRMMESKMLASSPLVGVPLSRLTLPQDVLVAFVFRSGELIVPHGNTVLVPNDNVYFVGSHGAITEFERGMEKHHGKIKRILIIGAGRTGRILAKYLDGQGFAVKIVDRDPERCRLASAMLSDTIVLCGDGTDMDLLTEEGAGEADAVICLTEDDKLNLLLALIVKHLGAKRTVVRVSRNEYSSLMEKVGIDLVLSSRILTSGEILRFVRKGGVLSVSVLEGAKAQAMEIIIANTSTVAGKTLAQAHLPKGCLVCAVVHAGEVTIPKGNTRLEARDRVVVVTITDEAKDIVDLFEGR